MKGRRKQSLGLSGRNELNKQSSVSEMDGETSCFWVSFGGRVTGDSLIPRLSAEKQTSDGRDAAERKQLESESRRFVHRLLG